MDEGGSKKSSTKITKQRDKVDVVQRHGIDVGSLLQSFWIRCRSVFSNVVDREFMESQLYLVLCCGSIFWGLLILETII